MMWGTQMRAWSKVVGACLVAMLLSTGCVGEEEAITGYRVTKDEARAQNGTHDDGADYCAENGWYGDGTCDPFCPTADADCATQPDPCADLSWYGDGVCDAFCTTPDPDCASTNACGGGLGATCPAGQVCLAESGQACGGPGTCATPPDTCTMEYAPVCGCNGQTYGNACGAASAGVGVQYAGECESESGACGGALDVACPAGEYCQIAAGACGAEGVCATMPEACTMEYAPVCGCDNQTYGNACSAAGAGVGVSHLGECAANGTRCGGNLGDTCATGEACIFPDDTCYARDVQGLCEAAPEGCGEIWAPVCGCDHMTYPNRCVATMEGVSVEYDGECETPAGECGGFAGLSCAAGETCVFPVGSCNMADHFGACEVLPDACAEIFAPVCGCDGVTYDNRCSATAAGVTIDHEGACQTTTDACGGIAGFACSDASAVCIYDDGTCNVADNMGACTTPPQVCPDLWQPVCGCEGQTYSNRCDATAAGVSVDYAGECRVGADCGGITGQTCSNAGDYCQFTDGACAMMDPRGTCTPVPAACPDVWAPVCGCDGVTYGNRCEAQAAKASIAQEGECGAGQCGGFSGQVCATGEACLYADGTCNIADNMGSCHLVQQTCATIYTPVCGCDGVTYGNRCEASNAGASVDYQGSCQ